MAQTLTSGRPRAVAFALVFLTAGLVLTGVGERPANADVASVKGSAFGYHAFNTTFFGGTQPDLGPAPNVTLAPDASNSPQTATATGTADDPFVNYFGVARIFSARQIDVSTAGSVGDTGSVTSSTDIQDINLTRVEILGEDNYDCCTQPGSAFPGDYYEAPVPRGLTDVASTCTASEAGVSASTTITNGSLYLDSGWSDYDQAYPEAGLDLNSDGDFDDANERVPEHDPVKVVVPTSPDPGTTYVGHLHLSAMATDRYLIVFNEQILNPDGSITVNAAHYYFGYTLDASGNWVVDAESRLKGEMILGQSVCGVTPLVVNVSDAIPAPAPEGLAGTSTVSFDVTLSAPSPESVTVGYATQYGSATAGVDYVYKEDFVTFAPGETVKTVTATINGDIAPEPDETFFIQLYNAQNASLGDRFGMAVIANDDLAPPVLNVSDATPMPAPEGNGGTSTISFEVTLSAPSPEEVTVGYATQYGSATAGLDYVYKDASLTFAPGQTSQTVTVTINGDTAPEADESFFVQLYNPQGAGLGDRFGMAVIQNDDDAAPVVSIGTGTPNPAVEGPAGAHNTISFPVNLSAPAGPSGVTVSYATMPGYLGSTATSNVDYVYEEATLTIPTGQSAGTITIDIIGDTVSGESTENLWVQIYDPSGASLDPTARYGEGFILDDEI